LRVQIPHRQHSRHSRCVQTIPYARRTPLTARLRPVRPFLAIFLLALLPLQFSWAAVASYCGHETQAGAEHFGHHDDPHPHQYPHQQQQQQVAASRAVQPVAGFMVSQDAAAHAGADRDAAAHASADTDGDKAPGVIDLDCGHCHGFCSAMLNLPADLPAVLATAPPSAALEEAGGAHAPTRPERLQWMPLA